MRPISRVAADLLLALATFVPALAWSEGEATPDAPTQPSSRPTGWAVQGLPIVSYNSDDGFGYGALVMFVDRADGTYEPFRYRIVFQLFQTTGGISQHYVEADAPRLLGSPWRVGLRLEYRLDKFAPYYGIGNTAEYEPLLNSCASRDALQENPDVCPDNPDFRGLRYYSFQLNTLPEAQLDVRRDLSGPWKIFFGYRLQFSELRARYPGSELGQTGDSRLLEDARAGRLDGYDGAADPFRIRLSEVALAVQFDQRDQEASTSDGMFHELAARASARAIGSDHDYWGVTLHLRYFRSIPVFERRPVLAFRALGDVLAGSVPFVKLSTFGGLSGKDGIGGVMSARGILKNRVQGAVKILGNAELRWAPFSFKPGGQHFEIGAVAYIDAGRVWSDLRFQDGGGITAGAGGGLRVIWNREFVVRVDYGVGLTDPTTGLYVELGQMF